MSNKKYLIIAIIIAAITIACLIGGYVFTLGVIIFKIMLGMVAVIIFSLGVLIGRFFPYKDKAKKELLKG